MKPFVLEQTMRIGHPRDRVFAFFSKAENLDLITPPDLQFQILTPSPIEMMVGTTIDYRIKLQGIPMRWRTLISAWEPPFRFVDEQIRGPYALWRHEHKFEEEGNTTIMTDRVEYIPRGWFFASVINRLFVAKRVAEIFRYRTDALPEKLSDYLSRPRLTM